MNQAEIQAVARAAGFSQAVLPVASAIAIAESGGNPRAHNPTPPDNSYGLWQINMLGSLGPARRRQFGISKNEDLFDPATNARAAYLVSSGGTNWRPWTTYTSGRYRRYLTQGQEAAGQQRPAPGSDAGQGPGLIASTPTVPTFDTDTTSNLLPLFIVAGIGLIAISLA